MSIRSKLAWTFIILLIFGITAISSYSIVFIRDYLLEEGKREMNQDIRWLAVTVENLVQNEHINMQFAQIAEASGYQLAAYDSAAGRVTAYPDSDSLYFDPVLNDDIVISLQGRGDIPLIPEQPDSETLTGYVYLEGSDNDIRYLQARRFKDEIYAPIKTIRWIIYYGMFISIGLVVIVSIWISRYLTRPITEIKNAARQIADGDVDKEIDLERGDEFGTLAKSLNRMAFKLREDTRRIRQFAEKQRQFFADITHEIRNPLHTISGALEMLEMEKLPEEKKRQYLKTAQNQTERINRLFKDLLTLQRFESDEQFIELQEFDMAVIGRHMREWYGEKAEHQGLDLEVDEHTCRAVGDPGKIEQVIDNLVSNALKYTNSGQISLRYSQDDGLVTVKVEDSGIGISEEHLGRLFDRFYRTDKARSRDKGGTGLGLAVVKSILDAHDSEIEVESQVGRGTTFWFSLPAAE